ncbi:MULTISPECIES: cupin domain-containing protein [Bacteria]|uniref:cupin domain-containing protein n=1 Tax=Bacteria TaxID=2 RepID=UPI003C7AFACD
MKSRLLGLVILPVTLAAASCTTVVRSPDADTALTPSPPAMAVKDLGVGVRQDSVGLEVEGPVSVTFREITIPPGGSTGMHCHHGSIVGLVKSGTLTHYAPVYPDGVHVYRAGDAIEEGPGYAHEGKNLDDEPLVLLATYVVPEGYPLAETDLGRCSR